MSKWGVKWSDACDSYSPTTLDIVYSDPTTNNLIYSSVSSTYSQASDTNGQFSDASSWVKTISQYSLVHEDKVVNTHQSSLICRATSPWCFYSIRPQECSSYHILGDGRWVYQICSCRSLKC